MGNHTCPIIVALLIGVTGCTGAPTADSRSFDLVIAGGRVVDGTGAPWFRADVGIIGDRIERIGDLRAAPARQRIDAANLVVSPGFIDMLGQSEFNLLVDNRAASKILQGVTTEITGEGSAIAPINDRIIAEDLAGPASHYHVTVDWRSLSDYFKRLEERTHPAINLGTFVGAVCFLIAAVLLLPERTHDHGSDQPEYRLAGALIDARKNAYGGYEPI